MNSRFPGGGGSRRDAASHEAVLEATRQLLVESGYEGLTVEAIAQRAGVGKPTLYRWWKNKGAIVDEAVWATRVAAATASDDVTADLRDHIRRTVDFFSKPSTVAALPRLIGGAVTPTGPPEPAGHATPGAPVPSTPTPSTPTPGSSLGAATSAGAAPMLEIIRRGQAEGIFDAGIDGGMVADMVIGGLISRVVARSLSRGRPTGARASDTSALLDVLLPALGLPHTAPPGLPARD